jgi:hypothetical protein
MALSEIDAVPPKILPGQRHVLKRPLKKLVMLACNAKGFVDAVPLSATGANRYFPVRINHEPRLAFAGPANDPEVLAHHLPAPAASLL